jgi:alanyl-tRNA synthetase
VVEIWNNVFMQFERRADGSLVPLTAKHVDTGMGFERLCMALQGVQSNYDTDVFTPLISKVESISGKKYERSDEKRDVAMRVIADHVRAVSFAIADGQLPSSGGAGYVIRRILRRAIRYGYSFLGLKEPFICQLVPVLAEEMGDFFPEIKSGQSLVSKVIREEEESFLRTLDKGIQLLEEIIRKTTGDVIEGKVVFELYDTFGFPADLTALIAGEGKKRIDTVGFEAELQKQKDRSRAATKLETEDWVILAEGDSVFIGYDELECDTRILKYRKIKAKGKESYQLVLSQTPFYAESGGQVGDTGRLLSANDTVVITDTRKENNLVVHFTDALPEKVEGTFTARVESDRRSNITANHSATHLLHEALREVLGTHVEQKGSLVSPDYLRFDFSHFAKMTDEEAARVETLVNERIRKNFPLEENRSMSIDDARKTGAMMLFGEKYGDVVRVIKFGNSVELCGGTHVQSTGEIGMFRIQSEGAVAAGVRRIEAISSNGAFQFINSELELLEQVRQSLKAKDVMKSIADLQVRNAELQKQIEKFNKEKGAQVKQQLKAKITQIGDVEFLAEHVDLDAAELKDVAFQLKSEHSRLFGMFASQSNGKATITCVISEALAAERSLNAGTIIRELAKEINGGGGGQAFFATAGGTNPDGLQVALDKAKSYIA